MTNISVQWSPRWYYVFLNKTSGKKYIGQTTKENLDQYLGSGSYWTNHCKKHGGKTRENIDIIFKKWFTSELCAKEFLEDFEIENSNYFNPLNKDWANQVPETTGNSAFCALKGQTKETCNSIAIVAAKKLGIPRSNETKQKISISKNGVKGVNAGIPKSQEHKNKLSQIRLGKKLSRNARLAITKYKNIVCVETGQFFETSGDAKDWLHSIGKIKATATRIAQVCKGERSIVYGYKFKFV